MKWAWENYNWKSDESKKLRTQFTKDWLTDFCKKQGLGLKIINETQFRIWGGYISYDIYPVNQKFHNLENNKRGDYSNLIQFMVKLVAL